MESGMDHLLAWLIERQHICSCRWAMPTCLRYRLMHFPKAASLRELAWNRHMALGAQQHGPGLSGCMLCFGKDFGDCWCDLTIPDSATLFPWMSINRKLKTLFFTSNPGDVQFLCSLIHSVTNTLLVHVTNFSFLSFFFKLQYILYCEGSVEEQIMRSLN